VSAGDDLQRVLVVRLDAIGDFILWLDSAKELRKLYPPGRYHITLLANSAWAELASGMPYWDTVWPLHHLRLAGHLRYFARQLWRIRRERFDEVVQPTYSRAFWPGDVIVAASGARRRVGVATDLANTTRLKRWIGNRFYTSLVDTGRPATHELEHNAAFLRALGLENVSARAPRITQKGARPQRLDPATPYFVVAPGAGLAGKCWPLESFVDVCDRIAHEYGWRPVVVGGKAERDIAKVLTRSCATGALDLTGQTSLRDLIYTIRHARIVVSNDTAVAHFAAALRVPGVSIAGGGHHGRFLPYPRIEGDALPMITVSQRMSCFGCNWNCIYPRSAGEPFRCVADVGVEQVWDAVRRLAAVEAAQR